MSSTITTSSPISPATSPAYTLPSASAVFSSLLKADLIAQWRNRRSSIVVLLIPSIVLFSWKAIVEDKGGAFALSNCITIGLNAIGLMGYTNAVARDRDKGIFQRLRVTPAPRWTIIVSRLAVQLIMIMITTLLLFYVGYQFDHIKMAAASYCYAFLTAILGGAVYLSLGQMIVGLVKTPETVNVTTRLVFFLFIMIGQLASFGAFGPAITTVANWSPYGTVNTLLAASLTPNSWTNHTSMVALATIGYTAIFTVIGIRYFRWQSNR